MNCSDAQSQMTYANVQGDNSLADLLAYRYTPQLAGGTTQQTGPFATAGSTTQQTGPFATAGSTTQQTGPFATAGSTAQRTEPSAMLGRELLPITSTTQPGAMTLESLQYLNGALRTQIGRKVTVDFLIGTNTLVDKTGTLLGVGANYIIINEIETDDLLFCDYYTIKFVKVYG